MRSRCRRSIMTMSTSFSPSRMSRATSTPKRSMPGGSSVRGRNHAHARAHRVEQSDIGARDPRVQRRRRRSPPAGRSSSPLSRRMVSASSSAWVGCSWLPSPALMTEQSTLRDSSSTAPGSWMAHDQHVGVHGVQGHRGVDQRLALAHRGGRTDMLMTSAPSRLPAISNEVRVRVEASKKQVDQGAAAQFGGLFSSACRFNSTYSSERSISTGNVGDWKVLDAPADAGVRGDKVEFGWRCH